MLEVTPGVAPVSPPPAVNGTPAPSVAAVPPVKVKSTRLTFEGDYAPYWVEIRTNPTLAQLRAFETADGALDGLPAVILAWNVPGDDGRTLPCTTDGLLALPAELVRMIAEGWRAAINVPLVGSPA